MPSKKSGAKKGKTGPKKVIKRIGKKATKTLPVIRSVGGRPSLLTDAKIRAIASHIEKGNFAVTACTLEDISERTFYHWLDVGQHDERAGKDTLHARFLQSIKKASAEAESRNVQIAQEGGVGWRANMTWLEKRFPDRWGHQSKLSMEEARTFVHRVMSALAMHITDRDVLGKIVQEVSGIQVEAHEQFSRT